MKRRRLCWFRNRIGKKIKGEGYELTIIDLSHARWLFTAQNELGKIYHD